MVKDKALDYLPMRAITNMQGVALLKQALRLTGRDSLENQAHPVPDQVSHLLTIGSLQPKNRLTPARHPLRRNNLHLAKTKDLLIKVKNVREIRAKEGL
jgi:hypothetical protein